MVHQHFAPASNFDGHSFWQCTETTCPEFSSSSHTRCWHYQGAIRQVLDIPFEELGKAISEQCLHAGNCDSNPKAYHLKRHWNNLAIYLWVIFGMTQNFGNLWHTYSAPNVWGGVTFHLGNVWKLVILFVYSWWKKLCTTCDLWWPNGFETGIFIHHKWCRIFCINSSTFFPCRIPKEWQPTMYAFWDEYQQKATSQPLPFESWWHIFELSPSPPYM